MTGSIDTLMSPAPSSRRHFQIPALIEADIDLCAVMDWHSRKAECSASGFALRDRLGRVCISAPQGRLLGRVFFPIHVGSGGNCGVSD